MESNNSIKIIYEHVVSELNRRLAVDDFIEDEGTYEDGYGHALRDIKEFIGSILEKAEEESIVNECKHEFEGKYEPECKKCGYCLTK